MYGIGLYIMDSLLQYRPNYYVLWIILAECAAMIVLTIGDCVMYIKNAQTEEEMFRYTKKLIANIIAMIGLVVIFILSLLAFNVYTCQLV